MTKKKFIPQRRREFRRVELLDKDLASVPLKQSRHHFDLIKHNISDGCTSTTSLFDEECGDVPSIFNPTVDKFELADELMRAGANKQAQKMASGGSTEPAPAPTE